jgi:LysR family nitrogen assimilation transcriptional regulator
MDIRQLRYFVGVVEAKSLNKASALLHVAQPALSTQIRNLERELGVKLLHRHARGIVPTKAGERLAQHAYQLLRQVERVRSDLTGYTASPSGVLLMCIARTVDCDIGDCRTLSAKISWRSPQDRRSWRRQVQADRLATNLTLTFRPEEDKQFLAEPLIQEELVLACSADDRRASAEIDPERRARPGALVSRGGDDRAGEALP